MIKRSVKYTCQLQRYSMLRLEKKSQSQLIFKKFGSNLSDTIIKYCNSKKLEKKCQQSKFY